MFVIITAPQDTHKRLVLQVYPGLNILESRPTCDLNVTYMWPTWGAHMT